MFSIKSGYACLQEDTIPVEGDFFKFFRAQFVPLKVTIFAWKLMLNGIPTRTNLRRRMIIEAYGELNCVFCNETEEFVAHLFFSYRISYEVWVRCYDWLGFVMVLPEDGKVHFFQHSGYLLSKKAMELWFLLWFTIIFFHLVT